jgi:hypothetical protein
LVTRSIKVSAVLPPDALAKLHLPDGQPRFLLTIETGNARYTADLSSKSVRKAKAAILEHGPEAVACVVQGKLDGNRITEAGLTVQGKTPKPVAPEVKEPVTA